VEQTGQFRSRGADLRSSGKRLYLSSDERRAVIAAAAKPAALYAHWRQNGHTRYKNILVFILALSSLIRLTYSRKMLGGYSEFRDRLTAIIALTGAKIQVLKTAVKRAFDVVISLVFLLFTAPVLCLTALAIFLEDGRPIFYREKRFGLNGRRVDVIKFRSMWVDAEKGGVLPWAAANDPRVTYVGSLIRKARIDELPQLFNVLRGDMTFVGPQPERPTIVNDLIKEARMRHRGWPVYRKRLEARRTRLSHKNPRHDSGSKS
jgi:hypothetical protein